MFADYVENSRVSMLEQYVDENAYSIQRARNMAFRPLSSADMDTSVKSKASEICSGERYLICNVDYMLLKATSAKAAKVGYIARNTYQMANEYEGMPPGYFFYVNSIPVLDVSSNSARYCSLTFMGLSRFLKK